MVVDLDGHGRAVLVRVAGPDGRQHAELTLTLALTGDDTAARNQLATLLDGLAGLLARATLAGRRTPDQYRRAA